MRIWRVFCSDYTCRNCSNAVFIKEGIFSGDKYYTCSFNPKKHKEIAGEDCGGFRCMEYGAYACCEKCNEGYPLTKKLRR